MQKKPRPADVFRTNLKGLLDRTGMKVTQLERDTGVSSRMIRFILDGERKPTVDMAEAIAHGFGLTGWQMLLPNLLDDLVNSHQLELLIQLFVDTPADGRDYVLRVAEKESKYSK